MTNLEYLKWFVEETYGAICFHNDPEDGYVDYSDTDDKKMETLAVYFANELDLMDRPTARRLEKKAGKEFYKRYVGARGIRLCPVNSSVLFSAFSVNGKTIKIFGRIFVFAGGIRWMMDYFVGRDIKNRIFDRPNDFCQPMPTNNDFVLNRGDDIKTALEKFLTQRNMPLVTEENGFYVSPYNYGEEIINADIPVNQVVKYFGKGVLGKCNALNRERVERFNSCYLYMSKSDWEDFHKARGMDAIPPEKSSEYSD